MAEATFKVISEAISEVKKVTKGLFLFYVVYAVKSQGPYSNVPILCWSGVRNSCPRGHGPRPRPRQWSRPEPQKITMLSIAFFLFEPPKNHSND